MAGGAGGAGGARDGPTACLSPAQLHLDRPRHLDDARHHWGQVLADQGLRYGASCPGWERASCRLLGGGWGPPGGHRWGPPSRAEGAAPADPPLPLPATNNEFKVSNTWLLLNLNVSGYFRVNYNQENWDQLLRQLSTDHQVRGGRPGMGRTPRPRTHAPTHPRTPLRAALRRQFCPLSGHPRDQPCPDHR